MKALKRLSGISGSFSGLVNGSEIDCLLLSASREFMDCLLISRWYKLCQQESFLQNVSSRKNASAS